MGEETLRQHGASLWIATVFCHSGLSQRFATVLTYLLALFDEDKVLGGASRGKGAAGKRLWAQIHVGDFCAVVALGGAVHPRTRVAEKTNLRNE